MVRAGFIEYFAGVADRVSLAAGVPRRGSLSVALQALSANLSREQDRWFPWAVAAFGSGIATYFALPNEPPISVPIVATAGAALCLSTRRYISSVPVTFLMLLGAFGALGLSDAQLRTRIVEAPVIAEEIGPVRVTGRVEDLEVRAADRARVILSVSRIDGSTAHPAFTRLTVSGPRAVSNLKPGAVISALAVMLPPPEPAMPNGYDFGRWAFFQRIGAVGFVYGTPRIITAPDPGIVEQLNSRLDELRLALTARIEHAIPGSDGSIAAALITGERGEIDPDDNQVYRDSGLAHVLSISGVHLALAGLGVFWVLRALFALWPRIALTYPIKKWAAVGAFVGSTFYLAISGGGSPADRSWLMLSMMLLSVMLDRPALSMRSVALAALVILILQPEDVVDPSFQMSFGAVIGLIALAEWQSSRPPRLPDPAGRIARLLVKARRYFVAALAVSFVATLATTPLAIYHFDRAAAYSLIANLFAEPVVAFVIMPTAALAVVVMPLRLELLPLSVMGWGVHVMSAIAYWVAGMPGATAMVRAWPAAALGVMVMGGLWIALWTQRWRWFGLTPIAAAVIAILADTPPDLFISRDLKSAAVRGGDGKLIIIGSRPDTYTATQWLIRDGDRRDVAAARAAAACDEIGCTASEKQGRLVAIPTAAAALPEDCSRAQVVISALPLHGNCPGPELVLDPSDVNRTGAITVRFGKDRLTIDTVAAVRGNRPWTRSGLNDRVAAKPEAR